MKTKYSDQQVTGNSCKKTKFRSQGYKCPSFVPKNYIYDQEENNSVVKLPSLYIQNNQHNTVYAISM